VTHVNLIDYVAAVTSTIGPQGRGAKRRVLRSNLVTVSDINDRIILSLVNILLAKTT